MDKTRGKTADKTAGKTADDKTAGKTADKTADKTRGKTADKTRGKTAGKGKGRKIQVLPEWFTEEPAAEPLRKQPKQNKKKKASSESLGPEAPATAKRNTKANAKAKAKATAKRTVKAPSKAAKAKSAPKPKAKAKQSTKAGKSTNKRRKQAAADEAQGDDGTWEDGPEQDAEHSPVAEHDDKPEPTMDESDMTYMIYITEQVTGCVEPDHIKQLVKEWLPQYDSCGFDVYYDRCTAGPYLKEDDQGKKKHSLGSFSVEKSFVGLLIAVGASICLAPGLNQNSITRAHSKASASNLAGTHNQPASFNTEAQVVEDRMGRGEPHQPDTPEIQDRVAALRELAPQALERVKARLAQKSGA